MKTIGLGGKELMRTIIGVVIEVEIEVLVDTEKGLLERKTGGTQPQITQL